MGWLCNLGNVAQPPPAVYRGKPQPGAAVPHIKLVNVIYFQALITPKDKLQGKDKDIFALRDFRLEKAGENRKLKRNNPPQLVAYSNH